MSCVRVRLCFPADARSLPALTHLLRGGGGVPEGHTCDCTGSIWGSSGDRLCGSADTHYMELISKRFASLIACFSQHPSEEDQ